MYNKDKLLYLDKKLQEKHLELTKIMLEATTIFEEIANP